jgi:hypothetical protein
MAASTPSESGDHSSIASDTTSKSSSGHGTEEEEEDEDYSAQKSIESTLNTFRSSNPVFWESKPKDKPGSALLLCTLCYADIFKCHITLH